MCKHSIFWITLIVCLCLMGCPVFAKEDTEEGTEEPSINEQVMEHVTGGLSDYWKETADHLTDGAPTFEEGGVVFRFVMKLSMICRRGGWILAILSVLVGIVLYLVSGMNKPMRRVAVFLIIGFPILMITFAFLVPVTASLFFYGT